MKLNSNSTRQTNYVHCKIMITISITITKHTIMKHCTYELENKCKNNYNPHSAQCLQTSNDITIVRELL